MGPDGKYRDLVLKERDGVHRHPSLLGLNLCLEDGRLYYFDPVRKVRLLTSDEKDAAWQQEKHARLRGETSPTKRGKKPRKPLRAERDRESAARQAAEARIAELERKLGGK